MRASGFLVAATVLTLLAACASSSQCLTYAQVQALNPGISACWVLSEFPGGGVTRWPDGTPKTITYQVRDPAGRRQSLQLEFDASGILTRKCYSGPVRRPPPRTPAPKRQPDCR